MSFELQTLEEYSDEAILAELRRVAESLNGQRLTIERFNSISRVRSSTVRRHFGSWKAALDKAGVGEEIAPRFRVPSRDQVIQALRDFAAENPGISATRDRIGKILGFHPGSFAKRFGKWDKLLSEVGMEPVPLGRRYTDEECYENTLTLWTHYGRQPHFGDLKRPPSTVGPKAYVRRWGGWRAALSAFVKQVNEPNDSSLGEVDSLEPIAEDKGGAVLEAPTPALNSYPFALENLESGPLPLRGVRRLASQGCRRRVAC